MLMTILSKGGNMCWRYEIVPFPLFYSFYAIDYNKTDVSLKIIQIRQESTKDLRLIKLLSIDFNNILRIHFIVVKSCTVRRTYVIHIANFMLSK